MKIAIVKKPWWPLPTSTRHIWAPGIVAASEAEGLVKAGHEVTVFAAKGSRVAGKLVHFDYLPSKENPAPVPDPQPSIRELFYVNSFIKQVIDYIRQHDFDIVHLHDYRDYPLFVAADLGVPLVATLHGDFELNFIHTPQAVLRQLAEVNLISLTEPRRIPEGMRPPVGVVPNTFDASRFTFIEQPHDRLAYVSRITQGKGADIAVKVAASTGKRLDMYGGQFHPEDFKEVFENELRSAPTVKYHGPLTHDTVHSAFNAKALLFPIREPEGFPLAVLEALSTGTPVITFDVGGMASIVEDGKTGFVAPAGDIEAMVEAVKRVDQLNRRLCREAVTSSYSLEEVTKKHVEVFRRVIAEAKRS